MLTTTKVGHVTFTHDDMFKGDIEIAKGNVRLTIPMEAIRKLAAESVRQELLDHVTKMKPEQLLRRIA